MLSKFTKSDRVAKMENTKVSNKGVAVVEATTVFYCDNKYSNKSTCYNDGSSNCPVVLLKNPKSLLGTSTAVRDNNGIVEVEATIQADKVDSPLEYMRQNIESVQQGTYTGPFVDMLRYWDPVTNGIAKKCWIPIEDILGNTSMLKLTIWKGGQVPKEHLTRPGVDVKILGCSFQVYLRLEKVKGAAKLKEENDKLKVVSAPSGPSDAPPPAPVSDSKRVPEVFVSISTNTGIDISENHVDGTDPLLVFEHMANDRRHMLRLPEHSGESFAFVMRLGGYQSEIKDFAKYEPGPSTVRHKEYDIRNDSYERVPAGVDPKQPNVSKEPMWRFEYMICQYSDEKVSEETFPVPWTLSAYLAGSDISLTGITRHQDWLKFGPTDWRGVGVFSVDARNTRKLQINLPGQAESVGRSGKIEANVKAVFFDLRETLKHEGIPVSHDILKTLYGDIYQVLTSEEDDGSKTTHTALHFDKFKGRGRTSASVPNLLHARDDVINLNECEKNVGHLLENADLYVLPYIPLPPHVIAKIKTEITLEDGSKSTKEDYECVREYRQHVVQHLRSLGTGEKLIEVLLGLKDAPALDGKTHLLYTADEISVISGFKTSLAKDKKKAEIFPNVLVGRNLPRDFAKYNLKIPAGLGFDLLLYMVQRRPEDEPRARK